MTTFRIFAGGFRGRVTMIVLGATVLLPDISVGDAGGKATPELAKYKIIPGRGLEKCSIGMPSQRAVELFGKPEKDEKGYLHFFRHGVEVKVEDGKIVAMFFHYRSKTCLTFDGETDKGTGMWSTIPQTLRRYGTPTKIRDSIVSAEGEMPGARDYSIEYTRIGIDYTFYNNELGHITIYAPER